MTKQILSQYRSLKRELKRPSEPADIRLKETQELMKQIEEFMLSIKDRQTQEIFIYRYIDGAAMPSWQQVARYIGGGNTADSVRKVHERYLKKYC